MKPFRLYTETADQEVYFDVDPSVSMEEVDDILGELTLPNGQTQPVVLVAYTMDVDSALHYRLFWITKALELRHTGRYSLELTVVYLSGRRRVLGTVPLRVRHPAASVRGVG